MHAPFWVNKGKVLISPEELSEILGISVRTIYNQTSKKAARRFPIPYLRIGRLIKFSVQDVETFLKKNKVK